MTLFLICDLGTSGHLQLNYFCSSWNTPLNPKFPITDHFYVVMSSYIFTLLRCECPLILTYLHAIFTFQYCFHGGFQREERKRVGDREIDKERDLPFQ